MRRIAQRGSCVNPSGTPRRHWRSKAGVKASLVARGRVLPAVRMGSSIPMASPVGFPAHREPAPLRTPVF